MKKMLIALLMSSSILTVMAENNVAVVDLQKVVSNSTQVKQLKMEHAQKLEELNKIIVNARGEISNEKDSVKILELEDKYLKEFNNKKNAIDREYSTKLSSVERSIKDEISKQAKAENYDYVFAKSVLLYGGKDITNDIHIK